MLASLIVSFVVAVVLSAIFVFGFSRRGPWSSWMAFFVVIFLASWAGGIWITPFIPTLANMQWLPFAMVGLITTLILAAAVPAWRSRTRTEAGIQQERRKPPVALLSPYYWMAIVVLVITIIVR